MTVLLGKTQRDLLNLDTLEKAFIWAVLSLRAACNNPDLTNNPFSSNVQFTYNVTGDENSYSATVSGEIRLNYNQFDALTGMADFIDNITNFTNISIDSPSAFSPSNPIQAIPQEPSYVNTLEKYLAWTAYILATSTLPSTNYIKINVFDDADPPILRIQYSLPINYQAYLLTGNLVNSSIKLVNYYITNSNQIPINGAILPSPQFWKEPVNTITDLLALPSVIEGTQVFVKEVYSNFVFVDDLPVEADETDYFDANNQVNDEGWVRVNRSNLSSGGVTAWGQITGKPNFANVATTGSYSDLTNKPNLANVATTGSYSDLTNKPTIPSVNYPVTSVNGQTGDVVLSLGNGENGVSNAIKFLSNSDTLVVNNEYWNTNPNITVNLPETGLTNYDVIKVTNIINTGTLTIENTFDSQVIIGLGINYFLYFATSDNWKVYDNSFNLIKTIKNSNTGTTLTYSGFGDTNGLFSYLGTNRNTITWVNPTPSKVIITNSGAVGTSGQEALTDRNTGILANSSNQSGVSVKFQLLNDVVFTLKRYVLREIVNPGETFPTQWRLDGSNDDINWVTLHTQNTTYNWVANNYNFLSPLLSNNLTAYAFYRIVSIAPDTGGSNRLQFSEVEFYGEIE